MAILTLGEREGIAKFHLTLSLFLSSTFMSLEAFAATQAKSLDNKTFYIPRHSFSDSQVYDMVNKNFKLLNGINYYGVQSHLNLSNITLIYNNPKTNKNHFKLEILTPDISKDEIISFGNTLRTSSEKNFIKNVAYVPFLVSAFTNNADANNNKLILENGELSSVFFLKPNSLNLTKVPSDLNEEIKYRYLITPAFVINGNANYNQNILKNNAYVNMGVENTYTLALNGAPYIVGANVINGDANSNQVILENNSKIDAHSSRHINEKASLNAYDGQITHILGASALNGNAKNNQLIFNGAHLLVHSPNTSYSSTSTIELAGAFVNADNNKTYDAINNSLLINELNLDLRVDSKGSLNFYNALVFGEFFGGRTVKGNANKNTVLVKNLETLDILKKNVSVQSSINFYGGYTLEGEANNNTISLNLQKPFRVRDNFYGQTYFNIYGAYATKGASGNSIIIQNDFNNNFVPENYKDCFVIYAARTLSGKANHNTIDINNSLISLPLYGYITAITNIEGKNYQADEASDNSIKLNTVKSSKNLSFIIEAKSVQNNKVLFDTVQSLSETSSLGKGSKIILHATKENANYNTIILKDYSSASYGSVYVITGDQEAAYNKIILNNPAFGTASDKRMGYVSTIAGVSNNTHDNILEITNLNIDEYKNDSAIILASAGILNNKSKSYNNTVYMGGYVNTFNPINVLAGTILSNIQRQDNKISALVHKKELAKNNLLILDTQGLKVKTLNNFENFSLILPKNLTSTVLSVEKNPMNLPFKGSFKLFTKDNNKLLKGRYKLIESQKGFLNENNEYLNQKELIITLNKMLKNKHTFNYKKIDALTNSSLNPLKIGFEVSDDAKIIYVNIL